MPLELRNPHSVAATLELRPHDVIEVRLQSRKPSSGWDQVVGQAQRLGIPVVVGSGRQSEGRRKRRDGAEKSGRTGSASALVKEHPGVSLETLFGDAPNRAAGRGLWIALDCLQDPHNVGAVFRSAAFFGAQGIVLTRDRSAPLNATVFDVASGGLEYTPFSVQTNLSRTLQMAKDAGLWILGTSEHADEDISQIDRGRPWLLVLGNEEKGLRRLTQESCDHVCRLSPRGRVTSLNVSVAAGILIASLTPPIES